MKRYVTEREKLAADQARAIQELVKKTNNNTQMATLKESPKNNSPDLERSMLPGGVRKAKVTDNNVVIPESERTIPRALTSDEQYNVDDLRDATEKATPGYRGGMTGVDLLRHLEMQRAISGKPPNAPGKQDAALANGIPKPVTGKPMRDPEQQPVSRAAKKALKLDDNAATTEKFLKNNAEVAERVRKTAEYHKPPARALVRNI